MPLYLGEPGSPDWWLARLSQKLLDRGQRYDLLERYYLGDHPVPLGDWRYKQALKLLQKKSRTNYCQLIADSPVERMRVQGFRFGLTNNIADQDSSAIWEANDLDLQSGLVHLSSAVFGDSYVMVSPPPDGERWPLVTPEDPRYTITEADPLRPRQVRAALKMWLDEAANEMYALVYTRDWIAYMVTPATGMEELAWPATPRITHTAEIAHMAWRIDGVVENPWGVVPIVRFPWRPSFGNESRGEFEGVLDIQDRINATVLDRMVISRAQAYKQRWAKGINVDKDQSGKPRPPFDPGADILWVSNSADAAFGEFKEADIRQVLDAVRHDVQDLAAISKTPPHYLIGEIVNASGDALKAAETGLVSKVQDRMRVVGASWEQVMKLCFLVTGETAKGKEAGVETIWADPESRSRAELADAALKESSIGVPFSLLMDRLQYTPQEIERAKAERVADEMRQTMLQIRQQKMMIDSGVVADPTEPANASTNDGGRSGSSSGRAQGDGES